MVVTPIDQKHLDSARTAPQELRTAQPGKAATDYLHLFGYTAFGYLWARMAKVALEKRGGDDAAFYEAKLATARFFMQRLLPQTGALFATIMAGSDAVMAFPDEEF